MFFPPNHQTILSLPMLKMKNLNYANNSKHRHEKWHYFASNLDRCHKM